MRTTPPRSFSFCLNEFRQYIAAAIRSEKSEVKLKVAIKKTDQFSLSKKSSDFRKTWHQTREELGQVRAFGNNFLVDFVCLSDAKKLQASRGAGGWSEGSWGWNNQVCECLSW